MVKTLELAMSRAAALSEAAQEQLAREILDWIDALERLRNAVEVGTRELEAGKGEPLDLEDMIRELHRRPAG